MSEQTIMMFIGVICGSLASYAGQFLAIYLYDKYRDARERKESQKIGAGKG